MITKKRSLYIDVMKGLLITLVVIGHLPFFEYDSRTLVLIYSFHMHAFLIIGGILSHVGELTRLCDIITSRIKSTLIPYIIFYIISFILIPMPSAEQRTNALIAAIKGIGVPPGHAINLPLWFLTFYFVAMLSYEFIVWLSYRIKRFLLPKSDRNKPYWFIRLITLLLIAIVMYISYRYARYYKLPRLPFNIEIAGFCLGFVFIGDLLSNFVLDAFNEIKKNTSSAIIGSILTLIILAVFVYAWYMLSMQNGRIDLNARDYKNALLMYIDAILGFIIFALIAYPISLIPLIKSILQVLGENSMYILAYHVPSVIITNGFIVPNLPPVVITYLSQNSIPSIAILTLLGIVLSLIPALIHRAIRFRT